MERFLYYLPVGLTVLMIKFLNTFSDDGEKSPILSICKIYNLMIANCRHELMAGAARL